jgi:ribosomal protein S18 acetylase RimI-like enzyme
MAQVFGGIGGYSYEMRGETEMLVRSFQLSDHVAINQLLNNVLSESCYDETMKAFAKQLSWDSELVLVAVEQDQVVGVIIGTIDRNNGYYYRIAVAPDYQRKGIGKAMIAALKVRFTQRKVKKIMVTVDMHNELILPIYESAGYHAEHFYRSTHRLQIVNG